MYIPRSSEVKNKKNYNNRLLTNSAYVRSIVVVAPKTTRTTTTNYVGMEITSGYSWYDPSFIYNVGTYAVESINIEESTGIHFYNSFPVAENYDFTPTYDAA